MKRNQSEILIWDNKMPLDVPPLYGPLHTMSHLLVILCYVVMDSQSDLNTTNYKIRTKHNLKSN